MIIWKLLGSWSEFYVDGDEEVDDDEQDQSTTTSSSTGKELRKLKILAKSVECHDSRINHYILYFVDIGEKLL